MTSMPLQKLIPLLRRLTSHCRSRVTRWCCAGALMLLPGVLPAAENAVPATPLGISLQIGKQADAEYKLEVRQMPLAQVLKEISGKTGTRIHYSVLPDAPVTATCVGATVKQIMDCLVAKQVGLVANKPEPGQPDEFWLLGSSVGSCQAVTVSSSSPLISSSAILPETGRELSDVPPQKQQKSDALLEKLRQANTPEEKVQALSDLSSGGVIEDPNVRKALNDAAMDQKAAIRSQAIITAAALDKGSAAEILANALHDKDVTVRMAALDMANGEKKVLEQALADSDASVRDYAAAKMAEIKQRQERLQR